MGQYAAFINEEGVKRVEWELERTLNRSLPTLIVDMVLGRPVYAASEEDRSRLAIANQQSLEVFRSSTAQALEANQTLHFDFALPFSMDKGYQDWLAGVLGVINSAKKKNPRQVDAHIRLLLDRDSAQAFQRFLPRLDLFGAIRSQIEEINLAESSSARELNDFLAASPHAIVFGLPESLERNVARKARPQVIVADAADLWQGIYPLSILILMRTAKSPLDAALLRELGQELPFLHYISGARDLARLAFRSEASRWLADAFAAQYVKSMA